MCEIGTKKDRTSSRKAVLFSAGCLPGMREMSGAAEKRTGGCN